ncbi:hypothetical protein GCM10023144_09690 [Pigmentiphaga soli]|uniref:EAL domain-containing protein n=2 Tax=Pigmentiphaga soli TaxID=1007095 RepID=A0ABP8GL08_9BURK
MDALRSNADTVVEAFYDTLARLPRSRQILMMLSEAELLHLKRRQSENLQALAAPRLGAKAHAQMALRVGRVHAIVGLDKEELVRARGILADSLYRLIARPAGTRALATYNRRLNVDLAWQLKAYQELQDSQQEVLLRLTKMVWEVRNYADFIHRTMEILSGHDEIAGCSIGRPDAQGVFHFEAASQGKTGGHLQRLMERPETQILIAADDPRGQGPVGLAWRSGKVERIINFSTSPQAAPWLASALREGVRSCASIPLGAPGARPAAILTLDCAYPGGFAGPHQVGFIDLVKTLLDCAFMRFPEHGADGSAISHAGRQHWSTLLRSNALVMHYQPLLDLQTGKVTKVEALARMREGDQLHMPGAFISALASDDQLELFIRGLDQALADRNDWLRRGVDLSISVNLPPAALNDIRYYEATRQALDAHACPPGRLVLEVLEYEEVSLAHGQDGILSKFRALGVTLAQDDLGSGHSGLGSLRKLPVDWIKLDRELVAVSETDAIGALRFIYQLTRLGHALGKSVVAEGIESIDFLDALRILGVDVAQGYIVAGPMPAEGLLLWMAGHPASVFGPPPEQGTLSALAKLVVWEERLFVNASAPDASAPDAGAGQRAGAAPAN